MIYLTVPEFLHIAERAVGGEIVVRDYGLLEAAAARPQATALVPMPTPDSTPKRPRCCIRWLGITL